MRDPDVKSIHYLILSADPATYQTTKPLEVETEDFRLQVSNRTAVFEMKRHFATREEARSFLQPFIRNWEVSANIEGHDGFRLEYKRAEIIDRAPPEESGTVLLRAECVVRTTLDAILIVSQPEFPHPPADFKTSEDVEKMFLRYQGFRQKTETLTSMAYYCLRFLERSAQSNSGSSGPRKKAAHRYGISARVLDTLARLTSECGDEHEARKPPKRNFRPLTPEEKRWIELVVRALIRRVGEWAYDPRGRLHQITMSNFPQI